MWHHPQAALSAVEVWCLWSLDKESKYHVHALDTPSKQPGDLACYKQKRKDSCWAPGKKGRSHYRLQVSMPEEDHSLSTDREVVFEMTKTGANCCTSNRADQHFVHLLQGVALMATPAGLTDVWSALAPSLLGMTVIQHQLAGTKWENSPDRWKKQTRSCSVHGPAHQAGSKLEE